MSNNNNNKSGGLVGAINKQNTCPFNVVRQMVQVLEKLGVPMPGKGDLPRGLSHFLFSKESPLVNFDEIRDEVPMFYNPKEEYAADLFLQYVLDLLKINPFISEQCLCPNGHQTPLGYNSGSGTIDLSFYEHRDV